MTETMMPAITFADLSETPADDGFPVLDHAVIDETGLTRMQRNWRRDGVVCLRNFIPDEVSEPYIARRAEFDDPRGWRMPTPYMHIPELKRLALYPPLLAVMESLIGEPMMLHLALSGWVSTRRAWHQDDYLNPDFVSCWYAAAWIALGDVHPDSGPFEYIPGSHRWPLLRREKIRSFLTEAEKRTPHRGTGLIQWEVSAERFMTPAIEAKISASGSEIVPFIAQKGDVLIWHGRLMHRGSLPAIYGMERRALITHYSGINHRPDMTVREQDENGQFYAVFHDPLPE
jgi:hypothetical protein